MRRILPVLAFTTLYASCVALVDPPNKPDLAGAHRHVVALSDSTGVIGTGVVVADGVVITAKHVAIWLPDQSVVTNHPNLDVSVIRMDTEGKTAVEVAPRSTIVGEEVFLVAFTGNASEVVSGGLTGNNPFRPGQMLHTCEASPGTSGGAMLDSSGRLVGIQLGCLLTAEIDGRPTYSDPEGRYLKIEGFRGWLLSFL